MIAAEIKIAVMAWIMRWKPIVLLEESVCYDAYKGIIDLACIKPNREFVLFEIKISVSDLKAELKKIQWKSNDYSTEEQLLQNRRPPNYFYFVIPRDIKDKAVPIIREHWKFAGIIEVWRYDPNYYYYTSLPQCTVIKRPKKLHRNPATDETILQQRHWMTRRYLRALQREADHKNERKMR